ncbi:MAG: Hsp20/alpha crystallin family protein [Acidobacteriota bacterium]
MVVKAPKQALSGCGCADMSHGETVVLSRVRNAPISGLFHSVVMYGAYASIPHLQIKRIWEGVTMAGERWIEEMVEMQTRVTELANSRPNITLEILMHLVKMWGQRRGDMRLDIANIVTGVWNLIQKQRTDQPAALSASHEPLFDITETDNEIGISTFMPGILDKQDLSVKIDGDELHVVGKSAIIPGADGPGQYIRNVRLPGAVAPHGATASYDNGRLNLLLKKGSKESRHTGQIDVLFGR